MKLDQKIMEAAAKAAANQQEWDAKHHPIRIGDKTYWLTTDVPTDIQEVLDVLPREREKAEAKRTNQIKTRLSDEELEAFDLLVKTSGLPQGEYIRGMVLHGRVSVTQTSYVDSQTLETLIQLSTQIGKIAGMIRQTVIVNKDFSLLTYEDKAYLEQQIRSLRRVQSAVQRTAEELYGYLQTQK